MSMKLPRESRKAQMLRPFFLPVGEGSVDRYSSGGVFKDESRAQHRDLRHYE
jgi:hypothetical protein